MITSTAGNIEYVNPKFTQITGYTKGEVIGKNPRILKSGETPPEEYKRLWDTITSCGTWQGEFHNRKKSGKLFWESAAISPVRNAEGTITHFIAIKEDITEIKQNEQRVKAQHAVTQILVESSTIEEASLKIIEVVCECLAWDVGELWLVDKQNGVLCLVESWHSPTIELPGFEAITRKTTFAPGIGHPVVSGRAASLSGLLILHKTLVFQGQK
jgi:PAS domain S-box-containing protein